MWVKQSWNSSTLWGQLKNVYWWKSVVPTSRAPKSIMLRTSTTWSGAYNFYSQCTSVLNIKIQLIPASSLDGKIGRSHLKVTIKVPWVWGNALNKRNLGIWKINKDSHTPWCNSLSHWSVHTEMGRGQRGAMEKSWVWPHTAWLLPPALPLTRWVASSRLLIIF